MSDGPLSEVPVGEVENTRRQIGILPREERQRIVESLSNRGVFFGISPLEGGRDTIRLEPYRDLLESVELTTIAEVAKKRPIHDVHLGIFDNPSKVKPEIGIYAHGYVEEDPYSVVEIAFDPDLSVSVREEAMGRAFRRAIRHELDHDERLKALGQDNITSLLDNLIFEGLGVRSFKRWSIICSASCYR